MSSPTDASDRSDGGRRDGDRRGTLGGDGGRRDGDRRSTLRGDGGRRRDGYRGGRRRSSGGREPPSAGAVVGGVSLRSLVGGVVEWSLADESVEPTETGPYRWCALACLAAVTLAYVAVLHDVVLVVGGVELFVGVTAGSLLLGVVLGATLRERAAVAVALVLLAAGLAVYAVALPPGVQRSLTPGTVIEDTVALLTGYSVLQLVRAGLWATAVVTGPTFLTGFFAVRGEYGRAAAVAGLTLGFFVLTGNADSAVTLAGVLAAAGAVAFGTLARVDAGRDQLEALAAAFALVILGSAAVSAVPGGGASPLAVGSTGVQSDIVSAEDRVGVGGSIELSPSVHFVVEADRGERWRAGVYDRFTGSSWIQTGTGTQSVDGPLPEPPGERSELRQDVEAKAPLDALPAAAAPHEVDGVDARVDQLGSLRPEGTLEPGSEYTIESLVPNASPGALDDANREYPSDVTATYLQLPESTPDRLGRLAENVTAAADGPYESANAIERWLEANKGYSLDVPRRDGNLAGQFLFEMDAGYCVYFATTMVSMLRSQDVPARYATGYTSGQQVDEDRWVVRGYDAHAWVEVYFPDVGWISFDPTPAGPRETAEREQLEAARESGGDDDVDAAGSEDGTYVPTTTTTAPPTTSLTSIPVDVRPTGNGGGPGLPGGGYRTMPDRFGDGTVNRSTGTDASTPTTNGTTSGATSGTTNGTAAGGTDGTLPRVPPLQTLALWSLLGVGLVAGARRTGFADLAYRSVWVRVQPRTDDPAAAVDGAFDRVMYVLGRRERERRGGETVREYLDAIDADEAVRRVAQLRERARHGGAATDDDAAVARELAARIVRRN